MADPKPNQGEVNDCAEQLRDKIDQLEDEYGGEVVEEALKQVVSRDYDGKFPDWAPPEDGDT